jgi:hypothetical protein
MAVLGQRFKVAKVTDGNSIHKLSILQELEKANSNYIRTMLNGGSGEGGASALRSRRPFQTRRKM